MEVSRGSSDSPRLAQPRGVWRGCCGRLGVHRVDSEKRGFGVWRGRRGRLGVHRVDSGKRGFGVWRGCRGRLGVHRVDSRRRVFGVWPGCRGRLGVHRVDSRKRGFGVWRGRRGRLGVHRVDSRKRRFGVWRGYRHTLVGPVDALAQPHLVRGADGLRQSDAEAVWRHDFADYVWGGAVWRGGHAGRLRLKSVGWVSYIC